VSDFQRELQALLSKHSMEAVPVLTCLYGFVERGEAVTQESSKQEVRRIRAVLQARGSNVTDQHSNLEQRPTARERAQRADPCRCAEVAVLPETTNRLGAGKHYAGCGFHDRWKLIETEIEAAIAAAREEERAPMECGHPKACWRVEDAVFDANDRCLEHCLACAREQRAVEAGKESLADAVTEAEMRVEARVRRDVAEAVRNVWDSRYCKVQPREFVVKDDNYGTCALCVIGKYGLKRAQETEASVRWELRSCLRGEHTWVGPNPIAGATHCAVCATEHGRG